MCRDNLLGADSTHPTAVKPYYGSLTGIAVTADGRSSDPVVYACGQPLESDYLNETKWFLYKMKLVELPGRNAKVALIEEITPLAWLGTLEMGVTKCFVSHQPGWKQARGSARMLVDAPKLWVGPKAEGKNAWLATARGCHLNDIEDGTSNEQCDDNRVGTAHCAGTTTGLLKSSACMLKHSSASFGTEANDGLNQINMIWESWLAYNNDVPSPLIGGTDDPESCKLRWNKLSEMCLQGIAAGLGTEAAALQQASSMISDVTGMRGSKHQVLNVNEGGSDHHWATSVVIGQGVEGMVFFDNKLDESHVAIARCDPDAWRDHCWLEYHWYDAYFDLDWMEDALRPSSEYMYQRLLADPSIKIVKTVSDS